MGDYFILMLENLAQVDLFQYAIISVALFGVITLVIRAVRG